MTLNGMHSQEQSKNSRVITSVERDSIYKKIQRGKAAEANVKHLDSALTKCDSVKGLVYKALEIEEMKSDSLHKIILQERLIGDNLEANIEDEIKRGRRRAFWSFLKGAGIGGAIIAILGFVL
jgi:hypothetical protein